MLFVQLTGLSGAGKTTISTNAKWILLSEGYDVEILDGDEYRRHLCKDLGFSKADRMENNRRLGFIGSLLAKHNIIAIMSTINPYEQVRHELKKENSRLIWLDCPIEILKQRDTKGLYKKAFLADDNTNKIKNLTGVNDLYETPVYYDLKINTGFENVEASVSKFVDYIRSEVKLFQEKTKNIQNGR